VYLSPASYEPSAASFKSHVVDFRLAAELLPCFSQVILVTTFLSDARGPADPPLICADGAGYAAHEAEGWLPRILPAHARAPADRRAARFSLFTFFSRGHPLAERIRAIWLRRPGRKPTSRISFVLHSGRSKPRMPLVALPSPPVEGAANRRAKAAAKLLSHKLAITRIKLVGSHVPRAG